MSWVSPLGRHDRLYGAFTQASGVLADGRQCRDDEPRRKDVVETDRGQVLRHASPAGLCSGEDAYRYQVVRGEDGRVINTASIELLEPLESAAIPRAIPSAITSAITAPASRGDESHGRASTAE